MGGVSKNAGRIGIVFKGDYELGVSYKKLDAIRYNRASYVSLIDNNLKNVIDDRIHWMKICEDGQDFRFEDFTPSQIEILQHPAIAAATMADLATQSANTATQSANTATQDAITATQNANRATNSANQAAATAADATSNTNTAIRNAQNATQNAIEATNEAEEKIVDIENRAQLAIQNTNVVRQEAITAIQNANTATNSANQAAETANNAKGWSPQFVYESDGTQRLIKKLSDWFGGTGIKPTANVGKYVTEAGGYTAVKSEAVNFKGTQSDNLVASLTLNDNRIITISSIDYTLNEFTSINHGLSTGDVLMIVPKTDCRVEYLPLTTNPMNNNFVGGYYVKVVDVNKFSISLVANGQNVILTNRSGNVDVTKFHFETSQVSKNISFTNLPNLKSFRIVINGTMAKVLRYINSLNGVSVIRGYRSLSVSNPSTLYFVASYEGVGVFFGLNTIDVFTSNNVCFQRKLQGIRFNENILEHVNEFCNNLVDVTEKFPVGVQSISLGGISCSNGTTIEIYKM